VHVCKERPAVNPLAFIPTPPTLAQASPQDRQRMAGYMRVILITLLMSSASIVFIRNPINQLVLILAIPLALFMLWRVQRDDLNLPAYVMPILMLVVFTTFAINGQGIGDPSMFATFLIIATAGLLLGKRAMIGFWAIEIANLFFINTFVRFGETAPPVTMLYMVIYVTIGMLIIRAIIDNLNASLEQVRTSERGLEQMNLSLEQRVAERTAQLEEAMAQQVAINARLRELDDMKSQFLASMSHELRTPLNAILNFTEFVSLGMMGEVNDKQKDALDKAVQSGRHLLALINDVLDMTKIEAGMMNLFVEADIDVQAELKVVIDTAQTLLKDKPDVELVLDIDEELPPVLGDRRRIRQVLLNLVSNAAKFTERGSVTLSAKRQASSILFAVIDTGVGIAPDEYGVIFEPFRQTEHGIQHAGGTGLGLPISRKLAEAHGGQLWLESEVGQGSAFYFSLPVYNSALTLTLSIPVTSPNGAKALV